MEAGRTGGLLTLACPSAFPHAFPSAFAFTLGIRGFQATFAVAFPFAIRAMAFSLTIITPAIATTITALAIIVAVITSDTAFTVIEGFAFPLFNAVSKNFYGLVEAGFALERRRNDLFAVKGDRSIITILPAAI